MYQWWDSIVYFQLFVPPDSYLWANCQYCPSCYTQLSRFQFSMLAVCKLMSCASATCSCASKSQVDLVLQYLYQYVLDLTVSCVTTHAGKLYPLGLLHILLTIHYFLEIIFKQHFTFMVCTFHALWRPPFPSALLSQLVPLLRPSEF